MNENENGSTTDTTTTEPDVELPAAVPEGEPHADASETKAEGVNPQPQWEYRKNFKVVDKMRDIVNLTIDVSKAEIARVRKQIDKLTYGS